MNSDTAATAIIACEEVIAGLQSKQAAAEAALKKLQEERTALSYKALAEGDAGAAKRIEQIGRETEKKTGELGDIAHALDVAKERLAKAEANERECESREAAVTLRKILTRRKQIAALLDEHLQSAVILLDQYQQACNACHAVEGAVPPTAMQMLTFCEMAVHAYFQNTFIKRGFRTLPPNQRYSFAHLERGWGEPAITAINTKLGDGSEPEQQQKTEAAHAQALW